MRECYRLPMTPVLKLKETDVLLPNVFTATKKTFEADCESEFWPEEIANLIGRCWSDDTDQRPSFDEIYSYWNFHRDRLIKYRFRDSRAWWFKKKPALSTPPLPDRVPPHTPRKKKNIADNLGPLVRKAAQKSADRIWIGEPSLSL